MRKDNDNQTYICPWCQTPDGKHDLSFSIIDDDCGQYVRESMIEFCPFCGRKLK